MKASFFMFFDYIAMMGVPVLLILVAVSALVLPGSRTGAEVRTILLILIAAGAIVYGVIGIREAYIHGNSHERRKN
jgi:hypothetical protein